MSPDLPAIDSRVAAIAAAANASGVFRELLDGSRLGAARAAILLCRHGRLRGWGSRGYAPEAAARLRALSIEGDDSWLGSALGSEPATELDRGPGQDVPDVGQPSAAEALALVVRVGSKTLAVLMAERGEGEPPLEPAALRTLTTVASLRLELDLAWRKFRSAQDPGREAAAPAPAAARTDQADSPAADAMLAPVASKPQAGAGDARHKEARTFAKLVATDIRLYNEEAVMLGRQHRDLAHRLGEDLERGRDSFRRRFPDLGDEGLTLLQEAYVQVLAAGDPSLLSA